MIRHSNALLRHVRLLPIAAALVLAFSQQIPAATPFKERALARFDEPLHFSNRRQGVLAHVRRETAATAKNRARSGTTSVVANCDDSGVGSLRDTVASAASGDTVDLSLLSCGVITLTSGAISTSLDALEIRGPGQDVLTIDGNGTGRVLLHLGAGTLTLSDMTLAHGSYASPEIGRAHV